MKQINRIISLFLVALMLVNLNVGAENSGTLDVASDPLIEKFLGDLDYIDDIYKYDLTQSDSIDEELAFKEALKYPKAVNAVVALQIMSKNDSGMFEEDKEVAYNDFAKIILRLSGWNNAALENVYDYGRLTPITMEESAGFLVGALGYTRYARKFSGEFPMMAAANELGILKGITINPKKNITRGELAVMIYNSLEIDLMEQTSYGADETFEIVANKTLLSECFNVIKVSGTLTAIPGANIYSTASPDEGWVEIDRAEFKIADGDYSSYLGHKVFGYAKFDERYNIYSLINLEFDQLDSGIDILISDIIELSNDKITYLENGKKRSISIAKIKNVMYNGSPSGRNSLTEDLCRYEGKVILGKSSQSGGSYDIAIVNAYESFRVRNSALLAKRIFFKDGMTFNDMDYIEANDEECQVTITKNKKPATLSDIAIDDAVSIMKSKDGKYIYIEASDRKVSGRIDSISGEKVVVNDKEYVMSYKYSQAMKANTAEVSELKAGDVGIFTLTAFGQIVGFEGDSDTFYGLMTKMQKESGLSNDVMIRVFTQNNKWETLTFKDKIILDGVKGVDCDAVYNILSENSYVFNEVIRYEVGADGKIEFLDTLIDNKAESNDVNHIVKTDIWSGELDWTAGFNLKPTNYSLLESTIIFYIPENPDEEEEYDVVSNSSLTAKTKATIGIYCANDFGRTPVATFSGRVSQEFYGPNIYAVENVAHLIDEDKNEIIKLDGTEAYSVSPGVGSWNKRNFIVSEKLLKNNPGFSFAPGDIFFYIADSSGELSGIELLVRNGEFVSDKETSEVREDNNLEYTFGTITGVDIEGHLVKIAIEGKEGEERVVMPRGIQVWEKQKKTYTNITLSEIVVGDKVLSTGSGVRHCSLNVFR